MLPVLVVNRNQARAEPGGRVAVGGQAAAWEDLVAALARADVVACSPPGKAPLLGRRDRPGQALAARPERPLLLVDLAVPRDIDPAVAGLPGVTPAQHGRHRHVHGPRAAGRRAEVPAVELIVAQEFDRLQRLAGRPVGRPAGDSPP